MSSWIDIYTSNGAAQKTSQITVTLELVELESLIDLTPRCLRSANPLNPKQNSPCIANVTISINEHEDGGWSSLKPDSCLLLTHSPSILSTVTHQVTQPAGGFSLFSVYLHAHPLAMSLHACIPCSHQLSQCCFIYLINKRECSVSSASSESLLKVAEGNPAESLKCLTGK